MLLTTHDMSDVEQLCSRVLIIDHGTLLYDGTLDGIRDRLGTERTLVVDLADDVAGPLAGAAARRGARRRSAPLAAVQSPGDDRRRADRRGRRALSRCAT